MHRRNVSAVPGSIRASAPRVTGLAVALVFDRLAPYAFEHPSGNVVAEDIDCFRLEAIAGSKFLGILVELLLQPRGGGGGEAHPVRVIVNFGPDRRNKKTDHGLGLSDAVG